MEIKRKMKNWEILALIILLAFALRLPYIGANFSGDEIDTVGPARHFIIDGDFRQFNNCDDTPYFNYTHPPVRLFLYSLWASFFGFSNIAIRLLPTLLGLASIVVIYLLGKELYSEKVGLIAAFLAAVSRYHIYGSNLVSTDTGHFMFTTSITVLFFVMYLKRNNTKYLAGSILFSIVSMMTKFSTIIIFIPILVASYFYKKKKIGITYVVLTFVLSTALLLGTSLIMNNSEVFDQPIRGFITYSQGAAPTVQDYFMDKVFKLATISWQMTPFFALLLLISIAALYRTKRDKGFCILCSWLILGFLIIFLQYGQDTQRYFLMMLAPAFLIVAKFTEELDFRSKVLPLTAIVMIVVAFAINLNDLMGYYQPIYLAIFYLAALVALFYKKYSITILIAGFIGMSIFFAFSGNNIIAIDSRAIGEISKNVIQEGYPYNETWTSKDVSYYLTPQNETVRNCELSSLNTDSLRDNNIKYLAFYSNVPKLADINKLISYCDESYMVYAENYLVGFACKVNQTKL